VNDFIAWLDEFRRRQGRSLRVLHIGNIANNAYINATIQRRYGIEADVICYEYYHAMACPEWADHKFEGVIDTNLPDWWATSLRGWRRPRWFAQGPKALCVAYLAAYRGGDIGETDRVWCELERSYRALLNPDALRGFRLPLPLAHAVAAVKARASIKRYDLPLGRQATLRGTLAVFVVRSLLQLGREVGRYLPARSARAGPLEAVRAVAAGAETANGESISAELAEQEKRLRCLRFAEIYAQELPDVDKETRDADVAYVEAVAAGWERLLCLYDIVQGYSIDGYIALYNGVQRYAAYEHGTLRTIPFEPTRLGRICRLAYRHAAAVFVTNVDVLPSVERLSLDEAGVVRLPHACDDVDILGVAAANTNSRPRADGVVTFLAPARHHWSFGGPSWEKGNDRIIRAAAELYREDAHFEIIVMEWGQEVERSKALIGELGCEAAFRWVPPMNKRELWKAFLESHCVLNQFGIPGIGGVDFEALTLGCRLVTCVDASVMERFFGAAPPILAASTSDEIAAQMRRVIADPKDCEGVGRRNRDWARLYHSSERVVALQVAAYERMLRDGTTGHATGRVAARAVEPTR
jgi:hypothetical protein